VQPDPTILALATAVPDHVLPQDAMTAFAPRLFPRRSRASLEALLPAYANAGIEKRHICVPMEWLAQPHGWAERSRLYRRHAVALLRRAATEALEQAGLAPGEVDALVLVSSTGVATPSLDALLLEELPFRRDVIRLPVFGLGCAGGALGLARAADLARATPGRRVLLLVVELCSLTFRNGDPTKSNVIAAALFGDGAAALLLSVEAGAAPGAEVTASGEWTFPRSLPVMGWRMEADGFGVLFSRHIPRLVEREIPGLARAFLARQNLRLDDIDAFALHPGGAKVLEAYASGLGLDAAALAPARGVLADFGNMSSATVLFVLRRLLDRGFRRCLALALGPGFTCAQVLLRAADGLG
jgi:alkylresorcinol/alkylpyrone synthase